MFLKTKKSVVGLSVFILIIASISFWIYQPKSGAPTTAEEAKEEAAMVKESLSKHLTFPDGDEPIIRKVTNKVNDPFFNKAEIGDYLIIFYKSRIAYIYSTEKNIIVNAGVVFANIPDKSKDGIKLDPKATATTSKN